jgi:2-polyprenyl-3-methyl-5-hydroxy-6-metoxy-1,4-benzoquinol methylase
VLIEQCLCGRRDGILERHNDLTARRCACGVARLETAQSAEQIERQYADGSYHESFERHANCVPYAQRYAQDERAACLRVQRYKKVLNGRFNEGVRVLDVGCANGAFVDVAWSRGYIAYGIDPHPVGTNKLLFAGTLAKMPHQLANERFDVITYHDVLEHLVDPHEELKRARAYLAPHGRVIVDVPDVSTPLGQHHWKEEHLWYFTGLGLAQLFSDAGFIPITIDAPVPGKLVVYGEAIR